MHQVCGCYCAFNSTTAAAAAAAKLETYGKSAVFALCAGDTAGNSKHCMQRTTVLLSAISEPTGPKSDDDRSDMTQMATAQTAAAREKLRRRIQRGAVVAVRAAGGAPGGAPLWLLALEVLTSARVPLKPLVDELVMACLGRAAGPLRVSLL